MELGFETIGNATVTVYDEGPVLATDPWIRGSAYFGSWGLTYEIPAPQEEAILAAPCVWFSHGHPDHLNPASLPLFRDRRILLPDHVGGRIATDLKRDGYRVEVLPDNQWVPLSQHVRVLCIADLNQDAILLIDVGGKLVVNLNDASDEGWGPIVKRAIKQAAVSFLLRLRGLGDADMINFFDESGSRLPSAPQLRKESGFDLGADIARMTEAFGASYFIPFSSFHRYQRTDSAWANEFTTPPEEFSRGFDSTKAQLLPAFVRYDCVSGSHVELAPEPANANLIEPSSFGDDWSEELDSEERVTVSKYFQKFEHLRDHLSFVNLRVGGRDNIVDLGGRPRDRGVTFEVPRNSLMQAVKYEIFDDLLIGNFMKTTLHGKWRSSALYPDFSPYVAKYGDNGRTHTKAELRAYRAEYRRRLGMSLYFRNLVEGRAKRAVRGRLTVESPAYRLALGAYRRLGR